jgi:DNA-binding XRE family transcriptional regulator
VISALIAVATFVALASLGAVIGAEFLGWLPVFARALVYLSVRQLPTDKRERYREEFLYDIQSKASDRNVLALLWALRTCIAARGLAKNLKGPEPREQQQPRTLEQRGLKTSGPPAQGMGRDRPDQELAAVLKRLREDRDITQEDLAYEAGLAVSTLSRIERGLVSPAWTTLATLIKALDLSLAEFVEKLEQTGRGSGS